MVQKAKARRGRPPAYDADAAMASVMDVFWHAGYAATSLDDISVATGMNRPSLYGAFGDKRALYCAALERYRALARVGMKEALAPDRTLRDGIAAVYKKALSLYFSGAAAPRGCFMIGTALTEAVGDPDLRQALGDGLRDIEAAFASRIRFAQKQGELAREADAAALASRAVESVSQKPSPPGRGLGEGVSHVPSGAGRGAVRRPHPDPLPGGEGMERPSRHLCAARRHPIFNS